MVRPARTPLRNSVRSQRLEVEAGSQTIALALQPRIGEINRRRLIPVIERVLRELEIPGRQVRIDRLELDLGEVPLHSLEAELPRLLERALRRAVADALDGRPEGGMRARPVAQARAELLERHLVSGTLPFWAPPDTSLQALVAEMADAAPARLAGVVRRLGTSPRVLERLAAQLADPALARLVRVLEPRHARLVLAYVLELRRAHRHAPLLPLGDRRFRRLLWMLVQAYLVRDRGSQFNRRSFMRSLLRGMARDQSLDYAALVATLARALEGIRRRRAAAASLPAVVAELLREVEAGAPPTGPEDGDRSARADRAPDSADAVWEDESRQGESREDAVRDRASPADEPRRGAAREDVGYGNVSGDAWDDDLLEGGAGWDGAAIGVDEVDAAEAAEGDVSDDDGASARGGAANLPTGDGRDRRSRSRAGDAAREPRVPERYETAEALAYLLRHGVLPWSALLRAPELHPARLLATLPDLPSALLGDVLRASGADERRRVMATLAAGLAEDDLARLLVRVLPAAGSEDGPFRAALAQFAEAAADRRAFLARVLGAVLDGEALDLEALAAHAVEPGPARPAELAAWPAHLLRSVLVDALRAGAARAREHPTPAELLEALARSSPADARYLLRSLATRPELASALARAVPPPLHERLLELLDPASADTARALHSALTTLPSPQRRAGGDELRQVVLLEMMRLGEGEAPGETFFARVLARVFGPRLPDAVGDRLLAAADAWVRPAGLPAAHADAFRAAVHAALGDAPGDAPPPVDRAAAAPDARAVAPALREAVFAYLLGHPPRVPTGEARSAAAAELPAAAAALTPDVLHHALQRMVDRAPGQVVPFLRRHSADRRVRERWAQVLPEPALARLTRVLGPPRHETLLETAEMLDTAWQDAAPAGHSASTGRPAFWGFLLGFITRNAAADRLTDRLVTAFFADRAARCRAASPAPDLPALGARLLEGAGRVALARGHARLRAALHRQRRRLLAVWSSSPADAQQAEAEPPASRSASSRANDGRAESARASRRASDPALRPGGGAADDGEPIYVANAGLVLVSPFIPHLFTSLGLLGEGPDGRPCLRDAEAVSRGVHLLQYLVDGSTATPEPALALNKVLCGVPLETPVDASADLTGHERSMCDQLLAAMIASWPAIGNSSPAALRETFLQREGKLAHGEARRLTVQRRTLDVLVDQVPWSISIVLHRWMPEPLHVSW